MSYAKLIELHTDRLAEEKKSESTINNSKTVINDWMRIFKCLPETIVGQEFYRFDEYLEKFLKALEAKGTKKDSLRAHKSRISQVKETFEKWRFASDLPWQFHSALNTLQKRKKISWKGLALAALGDKTKDRKIMNWAQNVNLPRIDSLDEIKALENFFNVPEGTLLARLPRRIFGTKTPKMLDWHRSPWGEKQAERTKNKERTKFYDWNTDQEVEFEELTRSKLTLRYTAEDGKRYNNNDTWRVDEDGHNATAHNTKDIIQHFYGFLLKSPNTGRFDTEDLSLALLADFSLIEQWISYTKERAGNSYNGYTEKQLNLVKMLTRKDTGFLWNHPGFSKKYSHSIHQDTWQEVCEDTWLEAKMLLKTIHSKREIKLTRCPRETLSAILSRDQPIQALKELSHEHEKERPLPHQSDTKAAMWHRDEILHEILEAIPLRMKTLARVTYRENGSGTLYRLDSNGSWHLRFHGTAFKNTKGKAKKGLYVELPKSLWEKLDTYIEKYRPILLETYEGNLEKVEHDVFLNNCKLGAYRKYGPPRTLREKAKSLSEHIRYMFRSYLRVSAGGHAYRHIIATDWLKNHPDSYLIVADILHDKIETVIKDYSHLRQEGSLKRYHAYLDTISE